jgi:hypothetical protein
METIRALLFGDKGAQQLCLQVLMQRLLEAPAHKFGQKHEGMGVYCLYYAGRAHPLYNGLTNDIPLYIGKAVSKASQLDARLREHKKSINQAKDLNLEDFYYKLIEINEEWVAGCESLLISHFRPLWNTVLTGFGNHVPGKGRPHQRKSLWDTLHEGRLWASTFDPDLPVSVVSDMVLQWCDQRGFPPQKQISFQLTQHFEFET